LSARVSWNGNWVLGGNLHREGIWDENFRRRGGGGKKRFKKRTSQIDRKGSLKSLGRKGLVKVRSARAHWCRRGLGRACLEGKTW